MIPGLIATVGCSKKQVKPDEPVVVESPPSSPDEGTRAAEEEARRRALQEQELLEQQQRQREMAARAKFGAEDIYFDFDRSDLKPEARATLQEKADFLRAYPSVTVIIEGHCDERGTAEYNIALGERRAEAAKGFLMNLGISGSRMTTISYGEEKPVAMGHNEKAWAKNRRVHFEVQ
jgi:peptidoglycan-associated lipoprotein